MTKQCLGTDRALSRAPESRFPKPQIVRKENHHLSGMARVRLADLNGHLQAKMVQNGPTILIHFGLANAKIRLGIRSF